MAHDKINVSMRRGKYNVSKKSARTLSGTTYMSKLEMMYRKHLNLLMKADNPKERVVSIVEQKSFEVVVNGTKICKYLLDFEVTYGDGRIEYVDVKGIATDVYRIKKKLVEALYPIKIKEVKKGEF